MALRARIVGTGVVKKEDAYQVDLQVESGIPVKGMKLMAENGNIWRLARFASGWHQIGKNRISVDLKPVDTHKAPHVEQKFCEPS